MANIVRNEVARRGINTVCAALHGIDGSARNWCHQALGADGLLACWRGRSSHLMRLA